MPLKKIKRAFKKITKPVAKVLDKVVPNEIKPFLPYAAAVAPYLLPAGIAGGSGIGALLRRGALTGGINLASQLAQEGSEGDFSALSLGLAGLQGALTAPGAAETLQGMTTAGSPEYLQLGEQATLADAAGNIDLASSALADQATMLSDNMDGNKNAEKKLDLKGDLSQKDKKTFAELKKLLFDATIKDRPGYAQTMLEVANPFDDKDADSRGSQERARAFDRGNKRLIYGIISTKNDPEGREKFVEEFTENYENMMYPAGRMAEGGIARLGFDNGGDVSFGGITEAVKNVEQKPRKFLVDKLEVTQEPGQSEMRAIIEAMYNDIDDVMPEDRKREFYQLYAPQMLRKGEMDETEFKFIQTEILGKNMKKGGIASLKDGGIMDLGGKEMDMRTGGFIPIGAKERADDVPARLSKNEFVMTADAVRAAGGGSVNKGAKRMYDLMHNLEARA
jgi:hypothetical protein